MCDAVQYEHLEEVSKCVVFLHDAERPRVRELLVLLICDAANGKEKWSQWCENKTHLKEEESKTKETLTASRPPQGGMRLFSRVRSSRHSFSKNKKKCDKIDFVILKKEKRGVAVILQKMGHLFSFSFSFSSSGFSLSLLLLNAFSLIYPDEGAALHVKSSHLA